MNHTETLWMQRMRAVCEPGSDLRAQDAARCAEGIEIPDYLYKPHCDYCGTAKEPSKLSPYQHKCQECVDRDYWETYRPGDERRSTLG